MLIQHYWGLARCWPEGPLHLWDWPQDQLVKRWCKAIFFITVRSCIKHSLAHFRDLVQCIKTSPRCSSPSLCCLSHHVTKSHGLQWLGNPDLFTQKCWAQLSGGFDAGSAFPTQDCWKQTKALRLDWGGHYRDISSNRIPCTHTQGVAIYEDLPYKSKILK